MMRIHAWVPALLLALVLEGGAATVSEIKVRREGGGLVEESAVRGFVLSLIHISEPTRPY